MHRATCRLAGILISCQGVSHPKCPVLVCDDTARQQHHVPLDMFRTLPLDLHSACRMMGASHNNLQLMLGCKLETQSATRQLVDCALLHNGST